MVNMLYYDVEFNVIHDLDICYEQPCKECLHWLQYVQHFHAKENTWFENKNPDLNSLKG